MRRPPLLVYQASWLPKVATGCLLIACSNPFGATNHPAVKGASREVTFTGMCDASGAVPLSDRLFAVADDEGNVLRIYDSDKGGAPLASTDLSEQLDLPTRGGGGKKRRAKRRAPEVDLEAATRIGDRAYWLTSHALTPSGKAKPERHRFFATDLSKDGDLSELVGEPYDSLLADLAADPRFASLKLAREREAGPRDPGGINIEGMTERLGGGVFIGFRNPVPEGRALIVTLQNPDGVISGQKPEFGDPVLLDLGGLGVRGLSYWHSKYLIAAGHYDSGGPSRLYTWDGQGSPELIRDVEFSRFNPEGFFSPEERSEMLLLSDDGGVTIDGTDCKRLKDHDRRRFRGAWVAQATLGRY